jgi:hypothetical protein
MVENVEICKKNKIVKSKLSHISIEASKNRFSAKKSVCQAALPPPLTKIYRDEFSDPWKQES